MILQALVRYYEDLLAHNKLSAPGWTTEKVSWALEIAQDGQLLAIHNVQTEEARGKKTVQVPQLMSVPDRLKRSSGIAANLLCDNSSYILGIDAKGKPARSKLCFDACRERHLEVFKDTPGCAAAALRNFFTHWQPELAAANNMLAPHLEGILKGGNIVFMMENGSYLQKDPDIQASWQQHRSQDTGESPIRCLVTGQQAPLARLHPSIKGVVGAQSSGASIVSFNAESFCSYGHEQGANAPVGTYAASAYTQALNYLLADREHVQRIGDTTVVCWSEGAERAYQDAAMAALFGADGFSDEDLHEMLKKLAQGKAVDWTGITLDPDTHFYVLGLAPNAARLSVRFFWQDTFGALAKNVQRHFDDFEIKRPNYDKFPTLPLYWLLRETVNTNAANPSPAPQLSGDTLRAILNGTPYPATLLNGATLRIRAEHAVTRGRAAILKAYYLRKSDPRCPKEVLTVELNKNSSYLPYVLGRLFAVLEAVQNAANPSISTTIRDRYFNSASSTPSNVFPTLIKLAQKHLQKMNDKQEVYYNRQITDLMSRIQQPFPKRMTLPEQGAFELGYYHQTQERFTKKEEV